MPSYVFFDFRDSPPLTLDAAERHITSITMAAAYSQMSHIAIDLRYAYA